MTDIIRPALYSAVHPIYFKDTDNRELVTVVGPICESGDVLIKNINVSKDIKIGNSVMAGGQVGISGHLSVGNNVQIAAKSAVLKNVEDNCSIMGNPAIDKYKYIRKYKKFYG